ncbi:response regulator [Dyadobacter aurulentus]|uniref:response regulator n=1 Tax=Dyadobacter sp. UC 10 TaxID=2605428 RepID=UPI0011F0B843|nr:response regulator [Dyadobacter sp. UC 10]KAA0993796.1 response regulator [Dyadobacter sp. UC 10]
MEFIIIDDSKFDLFTQEKLLLRSGLATRVRAFVSPQEAIDYLEGQTARIPLTVVLLDLQMPGLNGFEFAERYAQIDEAIRARIRLYMISSTVDANDIIRAENDPYIIRLLPKPLDISLLKSMIAG